MWHFHSTTFLTGHNCIIWFDDWQHILVYKFSGMQSEHLKCLKIFKDEILL